MKSEPKRRAPRYVAAVSAHADGHGLHAKHVQRASGLRFGSQSQSQPARLDRDVAKLVEKGVEVFVVEDDASERGIEPGELVPGVKSVARGQVAELFHRYDEVWHW